MREDLYKLLRAAVTDGLAMIKGIYDFEREAGQSWMFKMHLDYPTMSYYENGFQKFSTSDSKINFSLIIDEKMIKQNPHFIAYAEFVLNSAEMCRHFRIGDAAPDSRKAKEKVMQSWNDSYTYYHICFFCDAYIHLYSWEYDEFFFDIMFTDFFNSLSSEVAIDIYIPILLVSFESESMRLSDNLFIEKIPENVHVSRNQKTSYTNSSHTSVVGAANYAIVLKNWTITSHSEDERSVALHDIEGYRDALAISNQVFTALMIAIPQIDTGYAQVFSVPENWQSSFHADITQTFVASEKNYPAYFENYGWQKASSLLLHQRIF